MQIDLTLLPYLKPLLTVHQQDRQQPDNLCGPYWISLLLRAYGNLTVTPVEVAIAASTLLPSHGDPANWLPTDARSLHGSNYEQIPTHADLAICGTSITGLIQATTKLSHGQFCLIPLQISNWQTGLSVLLTLCHFHPTWQALLLLNPHTHYLWGTNPSPLTLMTYLQSKSVTPPPTNWSVGHFNLLIGKIQPKTKTLYAVLDTYPQFGWQGLHFQPPEALSQALHRPQQSTQGGLAMFVKTELHSDVTQAITQAGFNIFAWDNGSPVSTAAKPPPEPLSEGSSISQ